MGEIKGGVMAGLIAKGGWVMVPILLGSVAALALVLERAWFFWKIRLDTRAFADGIFSLVERGGLKEAAEICGRTPHPLAKVFQAGLERAEEDASETDRVMEREGGRQIQTVEKNLNYLVVVIGVEPLLGFLGTILGLIQAFMAWEKFSESVTVSILAAGIYQAMITTAAGLIIAIPYFVIYNIFLSKVNVITQDLNHFGDEFVSVLGRARRHRK
ncbi:MAG: MotA/TolQ/ExbB proton channel family protein [Candidatus Omnitrophota bacterium]